MKRFFLFLFFLLEIRITIYKYIINIADITLLTNRRYKYMKYLEAF